MESIHGYQSLIQYREDCIPTDEMKDFLSSSSHRDSEIGVTIAMFATAYEYGIRD